jgi:hypothetical protein
MFARTCPNAGRTVVARWVVCLIPSTEAGRAKGVALLVTPEIGTRSRLVGAAVVVGRGGAWASLDVVDVRGRRARVLGRCCPARPEVVFVCCAGSGFRAVGTTGRRVVCVDPEVTGRLFGATRG